MTKILITGANGLLGQKLIKLYSEETDKDILVVGRGACRLNQLPDNTAYVSTDITKRQEVYDVVNDFKPNTIINTAAMTNVDQCEDDRDGCWEANVTAVKYLVAAAEQCSAHFVHVSTDFIFDGSEGPLTEEAEPNPVNFYGESKLAAEQVVMASQLQWAIPRTVLVYGVTEGMSRSNIILWVKESLEKGEAINVVNDQWRTPTLAEDLAMGCKLMADKKATGIYNISGKDFLTPYEMAIKTADFFQLDKSLINQTDGSKFKQKAKRPPRTGFVITKAISDLGYSPKSFEEGIAIVADQVKVT